LAQTTFNMQLPPPSMQETILLSLAFLSWLIQLWFLLRRIRPLAFYKASANTSPFKEPVSIVICAKNEADNLRRFLPQILEQDYPEFQVVVVNDASEDDTELVLAEFKSIHPHLYYTSIPLDQKFSHGKKLALTIGVKAARFPYLLLTDADCRPLSPQWLQTMVQGFSKPDTVLILGFGAYEKNKGFANLLQRYDTFFVALQYLGFALSGKPYMGVGRNLAYTKKLFTEHKGVSRHAHLLSGDDDLFVQAHARKSNTHIEISPKAHTLSQSVDNLKQWRRQKARHLSTAAHYRKSLRLELGLEPVSRQILFASSVVLIFFNTFASIALVLLGLRLLLLLTLWHKVAGLLNQGKLYWSVLIFDWLHPWLLLWASLENRNKSKRNQWK